MLLNAWKCSIFNKPDTIYICLHLMYLIFQEFRVSEHLTNIIFFVFLETWDFSANPTQYILLTSQILRQKKSYNILNPNETLIRGLFFSLICYRTLLWYFPPIKVPLLRSYYYKQKVDWKKRSSKMWINKKGLKDTRNQHIVSLSYHMLPWKSTELDPSHDTLERRGILITL